MSHIVIDARIISSSTGRYVERLLHYLEKTDTSNKYTVLVRKKDIDYWKPINGNFSLKVADFPDYSISEQVGLLKLLRSLSPDLVHFCMPQQPILYRGKKVTTIHDLILLKTYNSDKNWLVFHFKQLIGRFVFRSVIKRSDYVLTPTDFVKNEIINKYEVNRSKLAVTNEAAETMTTMETEYPIASKSFIMYVGQQSDYKNIKRLGDAHQKLLKIYPDLQLVLVGKLNEAARKNQTYFASKSYKKIIFTDFVSDAQLNWLYTHCLCYVFPSLMEGFGLPGLEAMLHRAPVVSSNATCLPEVYGDAAEYFDPLDTDDMVRAILKVLNDKRRQDQLIALGDKRVSLYSWQKTAQETQEVYDRVLKP